MTDHDSTSAKTLLRAAEIGYREGLHFVYAGNLPGMTGKYENTYCPACRGLVIERTGFMVKRNRLKNGHCPHCNASVPGVWS
jgi:pyruvate formate lyase activating enzyme